MSHKLRRAGSKGVYDIRCKLDDWGREVRHSIVEYGVVWHGILAR